MQTSNERPWKETRKIFQADFLLIYRSYSVSSNSNSEYYLYHSSCICSGVFDNNQKANCTDGLPIVATSTSVFGFHIDLWRWIYSRLQFNSFQFWPSHSQTSRNGHLKKLKGNFYFSVDCNTVIGPSNSDQILTWRTETKPTNYNCLALNHIVITDRNLDYFFFKRLSLGLLSHLLKLEFEGK